MSKTHRPPPGVFLNPNDMTQPDVIDRLFARLEWQGECLVWTGSTSGKGYGQIGETIDGKMKNHKTHRVLYQRTVGPVPDDVMVLHWCDNPPCCNPEHLHLGDNAMNLRECVERGRHHQTRKTHCPQNHEYTEANTYINSNGRRECRTCRQERKRSARAAGASW